MGGSSLTLCLTISETDGIKEYKKALGDAFSLITAFSREGPNKVYVQHRLQENAKEVNELLQQKAYFYVCGDAANMAREVNNVLVKIIAEQRGIPEPKAEEIVKSMRSANQYQVRPCHVFPAKLMATSSQHPHLNKS
jgi:NADPH-ferrihemoprotein reductase